MKSIAGEDLNVTIYAMDEACFKRDGTLTCGWFPKGGRAVVFGPATYEKVGLSGAVDLRTGKVVINKPERFNKETFIEFIEKIVSNEPGDQTIHIILDNARPHRAKAVGKYLNDDARNRIILHYLPPYSPELNPAENIWRQLRREKTHNTFFPTLVALNDAIDSFADKYSSPNHTMQSLCAYY
jgi:transposase